MMNNNINNKNFNKNNIGFLGLGVMGYQMAAHLYKHLGCINIYNRDIEKAKKFKHQFQNQFQNEFKNSENSENSGNLENTCHIFQTPTEIAHACDIVFLCLGDDDSVRQTVQQLIQTSSSLNKPLLIIDHTTTSAKLAQEMAALALQHQSIFIDAPVSGGEVGAKNATLTMMVGGDLPVFENIKPILNIYSRMQTHFGQSGNGQVAKMVNQILIANILQGLSEGLHFAQHANLNIDLLVDTLKLGAAGSWQLENRGKTMVNDQFNFGFAIDLMLKDLNIVTDFAQTANIDLPHTTKIKQSYANLSQAGFGCLDTSALIKQYKK